MAIFIAMKKRCYKCKDEKLLKCFSKNSSKKDGLSSQCRDCHKEMRRIHYEKNKSKIIEQVGIQKEKVREWFNSLKNKPCKDCGKTYPPYVMDFDHLDSEEKEFQLGQALNWGKEKVLKEIAKCELVCANCHRERTHNRSNASLA